LAEFFEVDMSVTQRGLQGTVAKNIRDQFKTGTAPMGVSSPRVPEDVSSTGGNAASLKGAPNQVSHAIRTYRAPHRKVMMHKECATFGARAPVLEVIHNRLGHLVRHGQKPFPPLLGPA
jgi:hypothetical protein